MCAPNLLGVMGVMSIDTEVLAMVARCSRQAYTTLTPLLEMKLRNAGEMHKTALRFYPALKELPEDYTAAYCRMLVQHPVDYTLDHAGIKAFVLATLEGELLRTAIMYIYPAMRSAEGRRSIINATQLYENRHPKLAAAAASLRETVGRDMGLRFVIRRNREAFCLVRPKVV